MASSDNLTLIGILITAVGSTASVIGIILVLFQVRASQRSVKGEFLLHLTDQLDAHRDIYQALRDAHWQPAPNDLDMMTRFESYLSIFEQDEVLIQYGIIELEVFARLHGHRLMFILLNNFSYQLLVAHPTFWSDFVLLCKDVAAEIRRSNSANLIPDTWKICFERIDRIKL